MAAGERLRGANGKPGRFRRTPLAVRGAQPPACTPPSGYSVVASSTEAVITSHTYTNSYADGPLTGWYGCLRSVGEWRLLVGSERGDYIGILEVQQVQMAGRFVAFSFVQTYPKNTGCEHDVAVYDVSTGQPGKVFTGQCSDSSDPSHIGVLLLASSGFAAWDAIDRLSPTQLTGMSCPSVSLCVATDDAGNVLTTTHPTGGRQAWSLARVANGALGAISCPSENLCVAVAGNSIYTSTDPTGGAAAWSGTAITTAGLDAISCPGVSLCVAANNGGTVVTSTNPLGGASGWIANAITGMGRIETLDCPSTALCLAGGGSAGIGGAIATSMNPTGGASTWTATTNPMISDVFGISCPSTHLCVAGGGHVLSSTDPTGGAGAWSVAQPMPGPLYGLSCPSTNLCVSGSGTGYLLTSTDPTGGAAAWRATEVPIMGWLTAISCPSTALCVAGDSSGHTLTSTNPAGGPGAWSATLVDAPPSCSAYPCLVEHVYAYDTDGTHLLDTSLPGAGNTITGIQLSGNHLTWTDDGAPHEATLH